MRTRCGFSLPLGEFRVLCISIMLVWCFQIASMKHTKWQHMMAIKEVVIKCYNHITLASSLVWPAVWPCKTSYIPYIWFIWW